MFEVLAFERNDALIADGVEPLIDGHREMAFAEQRPRISRAASDGGSDTSSVETGAGAHLVRRGVVDHQHPNWTVALRLQDEAALELQVDPSSTVSTIASPSSFATGAGYWWRERIVVDCGTEAERRARADRALRPETAGSLSSTELAAGARVGISMRASDMIAHI